MLNLAMACRDSRGPNHTAPCLSLFFFREATKRQRKTRIFRPLPDPKTPGEEKTGSITRFLKKNQGIQKNQEKDRVTRPLLPDSVLTTAEVWADTIHPATTKGMTRDKFPRLQLLAGNEPAQENTRPCPSFPCSWVIIKESLKITSDVLSLAEPQASLEKTEIIQKYQYF